MKSTKALKSAAEVAPCLEVDTRIRCEAETEQVKSIKRTKWKLICPDSLLRCRCRCSRGWGYRGMRRLGMSQTPMQTTLQLGLRFAQFEKVK